MGIKRGLTRVRQKWQRFLDGPVEARRRPELPDPQQPRPWHDPRSHYGETDPLAALMSDTRPLPLVRQRVQGNQTATVILKRLRAATATTEELEGRAWVQAVLGEMDRTFLDKLEGRAPDWMRVRYGRRTTRNQGEASRQGSELEERATDLPEEGTPEWAELISTGKEAILARARHASDPLGDDTGVLFPPLREMSLA